MRMQDRQLVATALSYLEFAGFAEGLGHVQTLAQPSTLDHHVLGRIHQVFVQDTLIALALHSRAPSVEACSLEQEVHQGMQAHSSPGRFHLVHVMRFTSNQATPHRAHPWEVHTQLNLARNHLQNSLAHQLAQA